MKASNVNSADNVEPTVFFNHSSRGGGRMNGRFGERSGGSGCGRQCPLCIFCGLLGHTVDNCYKKHGYPIGFKGSMSSAAHVNAVTADNCP